MQMIATESAIVIALHNTFFAALLDAAEYVHVIHHDSSGLFRLLRRMICQRVILSRHLLY